MDQGNLGPYAAVNNSPKLTCGAWKSSDLMEISIMPLIYVTATVVVAANDRLPNNNDPDSSNDVTYLAIPKRMIDT